MSEVTRADLQKLADGLTSELGALQLTVNQMSASVTLLLTLQMADSAEKMGMNPQEFQEFVTPMIGKFQTDAHQGSLELLKKLKEERQKRRTSQ